MARLNHVSLVVGFFVFDVGLVVIVGAVTIIGRGALVFGEVGVQGVQREPLDLIEWYRLVLCTVGASVGLVSTLEAGFVLEQDIALFIGAAEGDGSLCCAVGSALALGGAVSR